MATWAAISAVVGGVAFCGPVEARVDAGRAPAPAHPSIEGDSIAQGAPPPSSGPGVPDSGGYPVPLAGPVPASTPPPPGFDFNAAGWPRTLPYVEGQPAPMGYHIARHRNPSRIFLGSYGFGSFYVGGLLVAGVVGLRHHTSWLAVPVAGPWAVLLLGGTACDPRDEPTGRCDSSASSLWKALLVVDSVGQALGIFNFIWGMNGPRYLVRNDLASVFVTPSLVGATGYGAVLRARF